MALSVTLRRFDGTVLRGLPDPAGGTFDAAGDFDALLGSEQFPILGAIDPYEDTMLSGPAVRELLVDVDRALPLATGRQQRGLRRLRLLAEACLSDRSLLLHVEGD